MPSGYHLPKYQLYYDIYSRDTTVFLRHNLFYQDYLEKSWGMDTTKDKLFVVCAIDTTLYHSYYLIDGKRKFENPMKKELKPIKTDTTWVNYH